jgi:hypothetical protein
MLSVTGVCAIAPVKLNKLKNRTAIKMGAECGFVCFIGLQTRNLDAISGRERNQSVANSTQ